MHVQEVEKKKVRNHNEEDLGEDNKKSRRISLNLLGSSVCGRWPVFFMVANLTSSPNILK